MKEFVEKLIERLEEEKEQYKRARGNTHCVITETSECDSCRADHYLYARLRCIDRTIEIVNQLAEEYINCSTDTSSGWIPCSERLPELTEGTECFKQSPCCLTTLEWWDGDMTESIGWYNQSGVWNEDSKNCKVIAWMPLPPAYVPKEGRE